MTCSAFWKHTNIRPGNKIYPCCRFKYPISDFDGDLSAVLRSEEYQKLRDTITPIPGCEKCYEEERIGHKSLREEFNEQYSTDKIELEYLEIGLDNICNLYCDGCSSEFSTRWAVKNNEEELLLEVTDITNVPSSVNKVVFLGGEPLITNKHLDVVKQLEAGCKITYNTNGMFIPNTELFADYSVHFILSLDGYGDLNSTVRGGSDWNKILEFISWVEKTQYTWSVNTVLHKNNIHGIEELKNFIKIYNVDWYINILTYPYELSIMNCDIDKLNKLLEMLEDVPNRDYIENYINDIISKT